MTTSSNETHQPVSLVRRLIIQPAEHWYLHPLADSLSGLNASQRESLRRQSVIGLLQTILLVIVVVQSLFAGMLRALPPDLRAALSFLHRIEWDAYLAVVLVLAQVAVSWANATVLTNRLYLFAWRLGTPRIVTGTAARRLQILYLLVVLVMIAAILWVRANGFIVQPAR